MVKQWDIDDLLKSDNKPKVIAFIVLFIVFYIVFLNYDSSRAFFIFISLFLLYIIYSSRQIETVKQNNDVITFVDTLEKILPEVAPKTFVVESTYLLHKPTKNFKYIKANKDMMNALYDLRFMLTYDKITLLQVSILSEYFLKLHFNVMLGKYDAVTYTEILIDIRREILNLLHSMHFVIPNISKVFESNELDNDLKQGIIKVQSITYRLVKIVFKKFKKDLTSRDYQGPYRLDEFTDNNYDMY
jgi:hypothetical protein